MCLYGNQSFKNMTQAYGPFLYFAVHVDFKFGVTKGKLFLVSIAFKVDILIASIDRWYAFEDDNRRGFRLQCNK